MIKAVIFDVDGTLLDTERIYMHAWRIAAKEAGYDLPQEALLKTRAINRVLAAKIFREATDEHFDYDAIYSRRLAIGEEILAQQPANLMPGVREVLDTLRSRGIPMAVASSTEYGRTVAHLEHSGIIGYFDAIVGGDMVTKGKPNPDIFWKAADLLGVPYKACMVVEDSPAGIRAAASAGMVPVLIPDCVPASDESTALSHAVLSSMHQLLPLLN